MNDPTLHEPTAVSTLAEAVHALVQPKLDQVQAKLRHFENMKAAGVSRAALWTVASDEFDEHHPGVLKASQWARHQAAGARVIWGRVARGKTVSLAWYSALTRARWERAKKLAVPYKDWDGPGGLFEQLEKAPHLVIDGAGDKSAARPLIAERVGDLIQERADAGLPTVLSTNLTPEEFLDMHDGNSNPDTARVGTRIAEWYFLDGPALRDPDREVPEEPERIKRYRHMLVLGTQVERIARREDIADARDKVEALKRLAGLSDDAVALKVSALEVLREQTRKHALRFLPSFRGRCFVL